MLKNLLNRILPTRPAAPPAAAPLPAPDERAPDDRALADTLIAEGDREEAAGRLPQAEALYRSAVAKAPGYARAHLNLGIVLAAQEDNDGAAAAYEALLAIDPSHAFGNYNYARVALVRGESARAERLVGAALRTKPEFPQALVVQSSVLDLLGKTEAAVESLEAALRLQPGDAGAWFNLALLCAKLNRPDAAEVAVRRALDGDPGQPGALALLASLLRDQGFAAQALEPLRAVVGADPASWPNRSLELLLMNFVEGIPADELFRRHVEFGADLERAVQARFARYPDRSDPKRRLRVGYLSGDLRLHTVAFFLLPVLEKHDRSQVEVFCYSYGSQDDGITHQLRGLSDHWLDAKALSDTQLADAIHADGIDILVDLAGHTGQPRLAVFAQQPAPVQVGWLGYLNTTGLTRMDYRLCDRRTDPAESAQALHTEQLVALPVSQWCYRPMVDEQIDAVAPLEKNGHVTFGSFNAALKISPAMAGRWGQILARTPGSRLIVANINSERKRVAIRHEIARQGVADDRVEFQARIGLTRYLGLFNAVDISLDSFPYGGGTTTFDSLWMGVPVVATSGDTPVSRSAASILLALGLDDWIAPSIDGFVDLAVARAADRAAILAVRGELRARLQASPLTDQVRYVRDLESAYRDMWNANRD